MPTYNVDVHEVYINTIRVEADNEKAARCKVSTFGIDAGKDVGTEYSHTLDPQTWDVQEITGG